MHDRAPDYLLCNYVSCMYPYVIIIYFGLWTHWTFGFDFDVECGVWNWDWDWNWDRDLEQKFNLLLEFFICTCIHCKIVELLN